MLPTGAGKSICFQLPALLQPGLTIVVSPLVALMENQVQALHKRHLPAAAIHSQLSSQHRRQTLWKLEHQHLRLLYLSPESLVSKAIWERLCHPHLQIQNLIVDEAHCIEQWGNSFRPVYRRLGAVRPALLQAKTAQFKDSPIALAAYTATANATTQQEIQAVLNLQNPQVLCSSPYRANLDLQVKTVWTPACRRQQLLRFIESQGQSSGLVYTASRRLSEALAVWLHHHHQQTVAYHAGLSPGERRQIETEWLAGHLPYVICTSAFGMGIDKSNVRWVAHYQPPLSLSAYLQEVGRAGRDQMRSQTLLLTSEPTGWLDPQDRQIRQYFLKQLRSQQQAAQKLSHQLPTQGHIEGVTQQFPHGEKALALLHQSGHLSWEDPFHFCLRPHPLAVSPYTFPLQEMTAYLSTHQCRWQFILERFGFRADAQNFHCGHCDRCRPMF